MRSVSCTRNLANEWNALPVHGSSSTRGRYKRNAARRCRRTASLPGDAADYLPLSLSFVGVELDASLGDGVVLEDELLLLDDGAAGDMLELELDDGVLDVPVVALDELDVSVDGDVVDGAIVLELELELGDGELGVVVVVELELDAGGVVDGVVVVDDVLLVSFWQPAAASAAAIARTAKGFGFI